MGVSDRIRDSPLMPDPLRLVFLGCGFITRFTAGTCGPGGLHPQYASRGTGKPTITAAGSRASAATGITATRIDDPVWTQSGCGAAAASSGADAASPRRRQARAGGEAGVPVPRGLRDGPSRRGIVPARVIVGETITTSRWRVPAAADRRRRDRRDGLRALHHDRQAV